MDPESPQFFSVGDPSRSSRSTVATLWSVYVQAGLALTKGSHVQVSHPRVAGAYSPQSATPTSPGPGRHPGRCRGRHDSGWRVVPTPYPEPARLSCESGTQPIQA